MKFGIFYEHQLPRPWGEGDELKLFREALGRLPNGTGEAFGFGAQSRDGVESLKRSRQHWQQDGSSRIQGCDAKVTLS